MKSKRLEALLTEIEKCNVLADIGTDHGYLVEEAISRNLANKVIATDISKSSLDKAKRNLEELQCFDRVDFRCGDGMDVLADKEADCIVIAGMGGKTITEILKRDKHAKSYILSPQSNVKETRLFLVNNGFKILKDYTVRSGDKYYVIIKTVHGKDVLNDMEVAFGRTNVTSPNVDFIKYIDDLYRRFDAIRKEAKGNVPDAINEKLKEMEALRSDYEKY